MFPLWMCKLVFSSIDSLVIYCPYSMLFTGKCLGPINPPTDPLLNIVLTRNWEKMINIDKIILNRQILMEGPLQLLDSGKATEMFVILFDDMLLVTRRKKALSKKVFFISSYLIFSYISNSGLKTWTPIR